MNIKQTFSLNSNSDWSDLEDGTRMVVSARRKSDGRPYTTHATAGVDLVQTLKMVDRDDSLFNVSAERKGPNAR